MYELEYKQTEAERFESDQNAEVQALIEGHGATIVFSDGGTSFSPDEIDLPCDQAWGIKTTHANALTIQRAIADKIGRPVKRTWIEEND